MSHYSRARAESQGPDAQLEPELRTKGQMPRGKSQSHEPRSRAKCQMPKAKRPESQKRFMSYESVQMAKNNEHAYPYKYPLLQIPLWKQQIAYWRKPRKWYTRMTLYPFWTSNNRTYPYWLGLDQKDSEFVSQNEGDAFRTT